MRFAGGIQAAFEGKRGAFIPQRLASEMVTAQMPGWGLGVSLYGTPEKPYFGHTGGNAGYRCELVASAHRGPAAAVMTNSDEGGAVVPALLNQLARSLGWSALERHGLTGVTNIDFQDLRNGVGRGDRPRGNGYASGVHGRRPGSSGLRARRRAHADRRRQVGSR